MIKDGIELSTALFLFCKLPWSSSLNKDVASRRSLDRNVERGINCKLVHLSSKSAKSIDARCCVIQNRKIFCLLQYCFVVRWQLLMPPDHLDMFFLRGFRS